MPQVYFISKQCYSRPFFVVHQCVYAAKINLIYICNICNTRQNADTKGGKWADGKGLVRRERRRVERQDDGKGVGRKEIDY